MPLDSCKKCAGCGESIPPNWTYCKTCTLELRAENKWEYYEEQAEHDGLNDREREW